MKYLALIPLVLVASCASRPPQVVVRLLPSQAVEPIESVRYGEVVRAYHVGRYIDPNHPETMHEQHPVYRVEVSARWNLHPGPQNTANLLNPPPDAAFAPPPTNDLLIAEMNRQRETTARVMIEANKLAQSYGELQALFTEMRTVALNNALLNVRLATNEQRVVEFGRELERLSASPPPATNDVPAFAPESPDFPKP
ncbi:MAG TPA: hypothetical protein PLV05_14285 [Verrucomicrobiota bacterium]|nr:hypothetical protein [Verrucomicrobiota bacterium]HRR65835.1 hypothetical protein [Candidatus Paceibacterota bacterium]HRV41350.1 hypothetical protein [Candidatus Paceibacterota bacterium]